MAIVDPLRFESAEDVQMRLRNTVLFYQGAPYFAVPEQDERGRNPKLEIYLIGLLDGKVIRHIHSSDDELDLQAKPLGYVNYGHRESAYIARAPARKPIQCLHRTTVYALTSTGAKPIADGEIQNPEFGHMLLNMYPTLQEAVQTVELGRRQTCAFHRKLAIKQAGKIIRLYYLTNCVGVYNPNRQAFALPERLAYYTPMLEGLGVRCFSLG